MPDPNVTPQEAELIREAFEEASSGPGLVPDSITAEGTKEAFCKSWPVVKEVLAFLMEYAPPGIRQAIAIVIKAGDKIFGKICPV